MEEWRDIPGYEGSYKVSNMGRVKSIERTIIRSNGRKQLWRERIIKYAIDKGYKRLVLRDDNGKSKTYRVHQLVAMAFLNHTPCGHAVVVDHIDHNTLNNHADNLRLISQRKNSSHLKRVGSSTYTGVCYDKNRNRWISHIQVNGKNKYLGRFINENDAAKAYQQALKEVVNGKNPKPKLQVPARASAQKSLDLFTGWNA